MDIIACNSVSTLQYMNLYVDSGQEGTMCTRLTKISSSRRRRVWWRNKGNRFIKARLS